MTADEKTGTRAERRKEETRVKILETAMKLFRKQGFDATTMEQIAEEADVAKGTLYNHFPVKEAIVSEYVQRDFKKQVPEFVRLLEIQPDTGSRLKAYLRAMVEWVGSYDHIAKVYMIYRMRTMLQSIEEPEKGSGSQLFVRSIIEEGQKNGDLRCDISLDFLVDQFDCVRAMLIKKFLFEPEQFSVQEDTEKYVDYFLKGAESRKRS